MYRVQQGRGLKILPFCIRNIWVTLILPTTPTTQWLCTNSTSPRLNMGVPCDHTNAWCTFTHMNICSLMSHCTWRNAVHAHLNKVVNNCCTSNFNERRNIDLLILICFPIYFNLLKEATIDATFRQVGFIRSTMIIMESDVECPNEWLTMQLFAVKRHKILSKNEVIINFPIRIKSGENQQSNFNKEENIKFRKNILWKLILFKMEL